MAPDEYAAPLVVTMRSAVPTVWVASDGVVVVWELSERSVNEWSHVDRLLLAAAFGARLPAILAMIRRDPDDGVMQRGLVRIIGQMAWPRESASDSMEEQSEGTRRGAGRNTRGRVCSPWGSEVFPALVERLALMFYRAILVGHWGKREDGTVVRHGLSEKVREKLTTANERRLAAEVLTRRVRGRADGNQGIAPEWSATHSGHIWSRLHQTPSVVDGFAEGRFFALGAALSRLCLKGQRPAPCQPRATPWEWRQMGSKP